MTNMTRTNTNTNTNTRVVIAYDMNLENFKMAVAIRGVLEFYGLQVTLAWLNTKADAINFFAGQGPKTDYTILCAHGIAQERRIWLAVVDKVLGTEYMYKDVEFNLTPDNIDEFILNAEGILISTACDSGSQEFATAFLNCGYRAFIAPSVAEDLSSAIMFICGFFIHLLAHDRDVHKAIYSEREAVERAAAIQPFPDGTAAFRYFGEMNDALKAV